MNLYAYAGNNPIAFSDPFGLDPCLSAPATLGEDGKTTCPDEEITRAVLATVLAMASPVASAIKTGIGLLSNLLNRAQPAPTPQPAAQRGTDFVVTRDGQAVSVPNGAVGPSPTQSPGMQFTGGSGGKGLDTKVTGVRIMDANSNQGPRVIYMNRSGQTVNPWTGRTVPNSDPAAHIPLRR